MRRAARAMYHPGAMHRTGEAFLLAILVAATPTVASLCELRCTAPRAAATDGRASACAGHAAGKQGNAPRSAPDGEHHDCKGHVLLAKGNGTGLEIQLARTLIAIVTLDSFVLTPDQRLEREKLASADSSPPSSRSTDTLRL
jgi:hypothetical protein